MISKPGCDVHLVSCDVIALGYWYYSLGMLVCSKSRATGSGVLRKHLRGFLEHLASSSSSLS